MTLIPNPEPKTPSLSPTIIPSGSFVQVVCIGEILWDWMADQIQTSVHLVKSWTPYPGGAPANVACGLVKLGIPAGLIGCVGSDHHGHSLIRLLETLGVNRDGMQCADMAPTRGVYVLRTTNGDRQFAGFKGGHTTEFADAYLQAALIPEPLLATARFLVLGTVGLAYEDSRGAILYTLDLAQKYQLKIVMDVNWRPVFWSNPNRAWEEITPLLPRLNFLKLTTEESIWLFGTQDVRAIAQQYPNLEGIFITAGAQGCTYGLYNYYGQFPAFVVDVEDTTGAGDGFLAGFLYQMLTQPTVMDHSQDSDDRIRQTILYANAVGALTTTRWGAIAAQPTHAEVQAFLYLHQQSIPHRLP